jgi:hypothetical protein
MSLHADFPFAFFRKRRTFSLFHGRALHTTAVASLKITGVPNEPYAATALQLWLQENGKEFGRIVDLQVLCYPGARPVGSTSELH